MQAMQATSYAAAVHDRWSGSGIWDYLAYDAEGDLWLGGLRVLDAIRRYGAPLEIVDTTLVERRCAEWASLARAAADAEAYPGTLRYLYAAKANMASEVCHAAYRSGWSAETSSRQDLMHLRWLHDRGLLPADFRVVCNGFKLPRSCYSIPLAAADEEPPAASRGRVDRAWPDVVLPASSARPTIRTETYAEAIVELARAGWDVVPVLDQGELDTFLDHRGQQLSVGLRMKHGKIANLEALDGLVSRFGLSRAELRTAASRIDASDHLRLTMLHAMAGAAEAIPVEQFVAALLVAAEVFVDLKAEHPTLSELNIGGGIPPLAEPYDHRGFLGALLGGVKQLCRSRGVEPPDVTFELGSLVAAECGFHVFPIVQTKANHVPADGRPDPWSIVDGGLMAAIPDMLIIDKPFRILAVEKANRPPVRARLGDVTCDSDGRYPPEAFGESEHLILPDATGRRHVLIQGVGAYQEILAGVRGAHHCGLLEAPELVLERRSDGRVHGRLLPRQTPDSAAELLGYVDEAVGPLAEALRATAS